MAVSQNPTQTVPYNSYWMFIPPVHGKFIGNLTYPHMLQLKFHVSIGIVMIDQWTYGYNVGSPQ